MVVLAEIRQCTDCGAATSGRYYCPGCINRRNRAYRMRAILDGRRDSYRHEIDRWHREHRKEPMRCNKCRRRKTIGDFYPQSASKGIRQPCKECHREITVARHLEAKLAGTTRESPYTGPKRCLCGRPRAEGRQECPGCLWLDGWNAVTSHVLSALQVLGGSANTDALEMECAYSRRNVLRGCAALLEAGRVRRTVEGNDREGDDGESEQPTWIAVDRMPEGWIPPSKEVA